MRNIAFLIAAITLVFTANAQPRLTFERLNHNFGTLIYKGGAAKVEFPFTNTGDAPLVLIRSEVECTCVSIELPRKPIPVGENGVVIVRYNPTKDLGHFNNGIRIFSNSADRRLILLIEGDVVRRKK